MSTSVPSASTLVVADYNARRIRVAGGQNNIHPVGQRLAAGEVCKGLSAYDHHSTLGGLPEKFPVSADGDGLGAAAADAPIIIYSNDRFHSLPQMAIGISNSKGWN